MSVKSLLVPVVLALLVLGLVLSLSSCNGGSWQPSSTPEAVAADTTEPAVKEPAAVVPDDEVAVATVEEPVVEEGQPSDSMEAEPSTQPLAEEPANQVVLLLGTRRGRTESLGSLVDLC